LPSEEIREFRATVAPNPMGRRRARGPAYDKRTVAELAVAFAKCEEEESMRAVTAVLRITREQLKPRNRFREHPILAAVMLSVGLACLVATSIAPDRLRQGMFSGAAIFSLVGVLYLYGALSVRAEVRIDKEEERAIKELAIASLERIWRKSFRRKPLEREHIETIDDLLKLAPHNETLRELQALS